MSDLVFNRISIFTSLDEAERFKTIHAKYMQLLDKQVGLRLSVIKQAIIISHSGVPVYYIVQRKLPTYSIGNNAIHLLNRIDTKKLFSQVLNELEKVWRFNDEHPNNEVSIDGRLSSWALDEFDPERSLLEQKVILVYLNTCNPVYRVAGIEQMDVLRTTPNVLGAYIKRFKFKKFLARYYEARSVIIDLMASFYQEKRPDLVPELLFSANQILKEEGNRSDEFKPIQESEVRRRYRQNSLNKWMMNKRRRAERIYYQKLLGREHPYFPLPEAA
jgi:hypothetical protein